MPTAMLPLILRALGVEEHVRSSNRFPRKLFLSRTTYMALTEPFPCTCLKQQTIWSRDMEAHPQLQLYKRKGDPLAQGEGGMVWTICLSHCSLFMAYALLLGKILDPQEEIFT